MDQLEIEEIIAEPNEFTWFSSAVDGIKTLLPNAWFLVIAAGIIYYLWVNKLSLRYREWREKKKLIQIDKKHEDESGSAIEREESRLLAINRLQDHYNALVEKAKEAAREKSAKDREELMNKLKSQGIRKLNENYYPLSDRGFRNYKVPARRTNCQGGC